MRARLVDLTPEAELDLYRLYDWLFERSPKAATRLVDTFERVFENLATASDRGRDLGEGLRELIVPFGERSYVVRYETTASQVLVARVWHGLEQR
ncbi:type II toxin-antitoxin system RelE/ParE family toxin [Caulobacter endophyticus]|uniref:Type II toxin-antitoxin system RelE/ParE family toxin n=1 Tax=Caulobacter endophyticus TaxID=2172652 RepID=A0A2T9K753_9CAUL|nr:type II toxin-antitoxin system RelE/ParE family toxin [Caulobacter endophyticus]PVM91800.1 type II toxin-antitoxin system RelE/ParE family toxin [Caulobacter endophyticus]